MELTTVGPVRPSEVSAAVERAAGPDTKLVVAYLPIESDHGAVLRSIRAATDAPVVGATTGGAAFTERGHTRDGVVMGLLAGDDLDVATAVARNLSDGVDEAIAQAVDSFPRTRRRKMAVLTLADAFATDGEALVSALRSATPLHCSHFGGTAGDNWSFSGTRVFHGTEVIEGGAVLAGIFTDTPLTMGVRHGWCAAAEGRELLVTKSDGNKLVELDGMPALEVYTAELVRLGLLARGEDPLPVMATFELGAKTPFGKELKIRAPLGAEGQAVVLASSLPERSLVRVVQTDADALIEAASNLEADVTADLPRRHGKLVFDCAARLQLLGDRYPEQVAAFRGRGDHPILGMACYGEIARFRGSVEGFHNTTAVIAAW